MTVILPLVYFSLFIFLIWKIKFFGSFGLSRGLISTLFILKIIFGFTLWAIYTYHYTYRNTSDAYRFFDDALIIFNTAEQNFGHFLRILFGIDADAEELKPYLANTFSWYRPYDYGLINDDRTMIRFNTIVLFFSFGNYHVHTIVMNFLSLLGLLCLYKAFINYLPDRKVELLFAVFLFPSLLFWGSGVLKEGLILFGLGMFTYSFFKIVNPGKTGLTVEEKSPILKIWLMFLFSLFLLCIIKLYVLVCMIPAIIFLLAARLSGSKKIVLKFLVTHVLLIIAALNIHHVFPDYNVLQTLQIKQRDFYNVAELWNAGSTIDIGRLEPNLFSFIKQSPQALITTFLRPHLLEANSSFLLLAALENSMLVTIVLLYLINFRKAEESKLMLSLFCLSFIVFLALLIGWTTPIMGAIVRYKLPLLPFLVILLLMISKKPYLIIKFETLLQKFIQKGFTK